MEAELRVELGLSIFRYHFCASSISQLRGQGAGSRTSPSCPTSPLRPNQEPSHQPITSQQGVVGGGEGRSRSWGLPIGLWVPHLPALPPRD